MIIGVGLLDIRIEGNSSLKGKRQVVKKIIERTKNRFNVSIAEIGDQDIWQRGQLGICLVANDGRMVNSILDKIFNFIEGLALCEIIGTDFEILTYGNHELSSIHLDSPLRPLRARPRELDFHRALRRLEDEALGVDAGSGIPLEGRGEAR